MPQMDADVEGGCRRPAHGRHGTLCALEPRRPRRGWRVKRDEGVASPSNIQAEGGGWAAVGRGWRVGREKSKKIDPVLTTDGADRRRCGGRRAECGPRKTRAILHAGAATPSSRLAAVGEWNATRASRLHQISGQGARRVGRADAVRVLQGPDEGNLHRRHPRQTNDNSENCSSVLRLGESD
jgi:hypothetical protein